MFNIRPLVSAVLVGLSAWCAAGWLTVVSSDSAALRLVVPASMWWFVVPGLAALLVPGWRRNPWRAAPALFATLPWWPVPLWPSWLIWTGPMAWLPIGAALLCGLASGGGRGDEGSARIDGTPAPPGSVALAGLLTLVLAVSVAALVDVRTPGGDEPHYLVITQSLLQDRDLRIENNHQDRDYAAYYGGTLAPDFIRRGADGEIYSIHAPGVSALVAPAFYWFGYRGAQATVLVTAALTGALIWLVGWHVTGRRDAAWFAWAATALTPTFLLQSGMVFPDGPGALAVAAALWIAVRLAGRGERVSRAGLVLAGAGLAALPWLHTRFAVLAIGFGLAIVWQLFNLRRDVTRRVTAFAAVPAVAAIAWFGFFWVLYGEPSPAAPYGGDVGARLAYVPGGVVALLFDQQFGLLTYAPVLLVAAVGLFGGYASPTRTVARLSGAIALAYLAAVATYWMWWAGVPATPARFLTAVVPIAALPLALAWSAARQRARAVFLALLLLSVAIAVVTLGVGEGSLAWNTRNAEAQWLEWLGPVVNLPRAWPSFFWRLDPADLSTEWVFVVHVLVFVLVIAGGIAVGSAFGGPPRTAFRATTVRLAWALPVAFMGAVAAGWTLNHVSGLDPARSQLALTARVAAGGRAWRVGPWGAAPEADGASALRIRSEEPGRTDAPPPWAVFADVPAGSYELHADMLTSGGGAMRVHIGRSADPIAAVALTPGPQIVAVSLPAGASVLTVARDVEDGGLDGRVELRPIEVAAPNGALARSLARYDAVDVFFLDAGAFVEPLGFWVRGASESAFVVALTAGAGELALDVRNGAAANELVVEIDGESQTLTLGPSEAHRFVAPAAGRAVRVRIRSQAGFRPSDVGASEDRRFLGVWVEVVGSGLVLPHP